MSNQDSPRYQAVVNDAGQLGIWPADGTPPNGWRGLGQHGSRAECLDWVAAEGGQLKPSGATGRTLVAMFDETVRRHADRPAVSQGDDIVTYAELDRRSAHLAGRLGEVGLAAEDRVALCLGRGVDVVVGILGVLRAGGAYVAIDEHLPAARQALMIRESGATVILTGPGRADRFTDVAEKTRVVEWHSADAAGDPGPVPAGPAPDSAACLLFTSGSSGIPKAVVLEHAGLVAFAENPVFAGLTAEDRTAHLSPLAFDAFHFELWATLAAGAELVVLPMLSDMLGTDVRRELRRRRISAALVPTMGLNHLVREDRDTFGSLRLLYTGGDVLSRQTCLDVLAGEFDGVFVNLYGPTEATTACTGYEIADEDAVRDGVPIGSALAGCRVTVRRPDLTEAPVGEVGELHIGGVGVARGYLGSPDLTVDRFRPDPDGPPGARLYATGDLAVRRPDGLLEFRGRADDQVKIRGYRVETGEVERAIARHPQVAEAAVLAGGEGDERHLAAFVVALETVAPAQLRAHLAESLPDHMVPRVILLVDHLPATDHGKRDREQLATMLDEHRKREENHVPPATDSERYVAQVWGALLGAERISADDDFFELGGHSLLAFRAQRRIRRDLGVDLDFGDLLSNSRLRDLARLLDSQRQVSA
ncbi:amino acid adenylation domain-containing protein [Micromonospora sp. R77]|uniref:amino acid adenylation domain-containing protein n=1 Tax=Micromonospora sp. R77 TaxID=2925836 RepID=UPI001F60640E|nr:amino acid adenylation domain-containing protein [Micromonospora sp. R77]MCI4066799.1 amino acid adenylation domain-containing protein [Micromonospora sp. R77]